jgi:hypothetical protein
VSEGFSSVRWLRHLRETQFIFPEHAVRATGCG